MRRVRQTIALLAATLAGLATHASITAPKTVAADEIVIWVGAASRSVSIEDLAIYAETGERSRQLNVYFSDFMSDEQALGVRRALNMKVQLDFVPFTQNLRSPGGGCFLQEIATVVQPPARNINGSQALRAALINASAPDGQMTLLEFLQEYPNRQIWLEQDQLAGSSDRATEFRQNFRQLLVDSGVPLDGPTDSGMDDATIDEDGGQSLPPIPLLSIDWDRLAAGSEALCNTET